jgi:plasmid stability protein
VVSDCTGFHQLAFQMQCMQNASMSIQITIRNVPKEVRDELASRAALRHQSMQEYLRGELERIATRPTIESWLKTVRERKAAAGTRIPAKKIVDARNADRK